MKMLKCPECGQEIEYLINEYVEEVAVCRVYPDENHGVFYFDLEPVDAENSISRPNIDLYYCPKCKALLFDNEEDAKAFLRGELNNAEEES